MSAGWKGEVLDLVDGYLVPTTRKWDEEQHPRVPAGSADGGEFAEAGGPSGSATAAGATSALGRYSDSKNLFEVETRFNADHAYRDKSPLHINFKEPVPIGVAARIANRLDQLDARFGKVAAINEVMIGTQADANGNWGIYIPGASMVVLNGDALGSDFETKYAYSATPAASGSSSNSLPFHPPAVNGVEEVVAHEYGHAVEDGLKGTDKAWAEYSRPSGLGAIKDTLRDFMEAHHTGVDDDKDRPLVSAYAMKNEGEWFAETFAALHTGTPQVRDNKQVKDMKAFLDIVADPAEWHEIKWTDQAPKGGNWYALLHEAGAKMGLSERFLA